MAAINKSVVGQAKLQQTEFTSPNGPAPDGPGELYTVKAGDTMWDIAKDKLGDANEWKNIADLNKQIADAHKIWPGDEIRLPPIKEKPLTDIALEEKTALPEDEESLTNFTKDATLQEKNKTGYLNFLANDKSVVDKTVTDALEKLPKEGEISGKAMQKAIIDGTKDLDSRAADAEYKQLDAYRDDNWDRMAPDAKAKWGVYDKHAQAAQEKGLSGIPADDYDKMVAEMKDAGYRDASSGKAVEMLKEAKKPISGAKMQKAILEGTKDYDKQSANREYQDLKGYVDNNSDKLSKTAKKKFAVYERFAQEAQENGDTGIKKSDWDKMAAEMKAIQAPKKKAKATKTSEADKTAETGKTVETDKGKEVKKAEKADTFDWAGFPAEARSPELKELITQLRELGLSEESPGTWALPKTEKANPIYPKGNTNGEKYNPDDLTPELKQLLEQKQAYEDALKAETPLSDVASVAERAAAAYEKSAAAFDKLPQERQLEIVQTLARLDESMAAFASADSPGGETITLNEMNHLISLAKTLPADIQKSIKAEAMALPLEYDASPEALNAMYAYINGGIAGDIPVATDKAEETDAFDWAGLPAEVRSPELKELLTQLRKAGTAEQVAAKDNIDDLSSEIKQLLKDATLNETTSEAERAAIAYAKSAAAFDKLPEKRQLEIVETLGKLDQSLTDFVSAGGKGGETITLNEMNQLIALAKTLPADIQKSVKAEALAVLLEHDASPEALEAMYRYLNAGIDGKTPVVTDVTEGKTAKRVASDVRRAVLTKDKEALLKSLRGKSKGEIELMRKAYKAVYDQDMDVDIRSLFGGRDLKKANKMLKGDQVGAARIALDQAMNRAGLGGFWDGTNEDAVYTALQDLSEDQLKELREDKKLVKKFRSEFSGVELERVLALLRGDRGLADAAGLNHALNEGDFEAVSKILKDRSAEEINAMKTSHLAEFGELDFGELSKTEKMKVQEMLSGLNRDD